jgi:hypothetical protein
VRALLALTALVAGAASVLAQSVPEAETSPATLRPLSDFTAIADERERALALFAEVGKVVQHPRCLNCHPADDSPRQGLAMTVHQPPVARGEADFGLPGMQCTTCHTAANVVLAAQADGIRSIPGHPAWHLAPKEQAWVGKSLGAICEQIKDPARNGGRSMADLVEHMAHDTLVGWGWNPGAGREPVPGTQAEFGALVTAWSEAGAHCPAP